MLDIERHRLVIAEHDLVAQVIDQLAWGLGGEIVWDYLKVGGLSNSNSSSSSRVLFHTFCMSPQI